MNNLNMRIKQLRQKKGLTQFEFAEKSDISVSLLAKVETGQLDNITLSTLTKIAKASDVTVATLLSEKKPQDFELEVLINQISNLTKKKRTKLISIFNEILSFSK